MEREATASAQQSHTSAGRCGQLQLLHPCIPHMPRLWLLVARGKCSSSLGQRGKAGPKPQFSGRRTVHKKTAKFFWASNHYAMAKKMHRTELIICIESMGNQEERTLNPCSDNTPVLINSNQVYLYLAKSLGGESSYIHFNPKSCWERGVQKWINKREVTRKCWNSNATRRDDRVF